MNDNKSSSSHKHVVVVCHAWYGDTIGGSFRLASEFAEHLAALNYRVSFICCGPDQQPLLPDTEVIRGVNIYRYSPSKVRRAGLGRLRYHVSQTRKIVLRIHQQNPVSALSSHSPLQGLGACYALNGKPVFKNYTVHSPFDDELLSNNDNGGSPGVLTRIAGKLAHWVDRQNIRFADRVQTDSRYTLDNLSQKHSRALADKGIVSPGWVDVEQFSTHQSREELREQLPECWQTDDPIFFTLRRLEARMGLDTFIDAAHLAMQNGKRFRVLIGGGGSLSEALQQRIDAAGMTEHIHLLGRLPEEHLSLCYAAADCFVLPTRALECFGLIVLEALAAGTPVIASRAAAIPELAEQQGSEWMFEPGNVTQLANRLQAFLSGELKPSIDFAEMVARYDRPVILREWTKLLLGAESVGAES